MSKKVKSKEDVPVVGNTLIADIRHMRMEVIDPKTGKMVKPILIHIFDWHSKYTLGFSFVVDEDLKEKTVKLIGDVIAAYEIVPKTIYATRDRYWLQMFKVLGISIDIEDFVFCRKVWSCINNFHKDFRKYFSRALIEASFQYKEPIELATFRAMFECFVTMFFNKSTYTISGKTPEDLFLEGYPKIFEGEKEDETKD